MKFNKKLLIASLLPLSIFMFIFVYSPIETDTPKSLPCVTTIAEVEPIPRTPSEKKEGIVSYYGDRWNGRTTANMEIYQSNLLTCASPTLPFNTMLKITNLDNNKSVIVRVNDRGPFKMDKKGKALWPLEPHPKRIFDLSKGSFSKIGDLKKGLLRVKYEILIDE